MRLVRRRSVQPAEGARGLGFCRPETPRNRREQPDPGDAGWQARTTWALSNQYRRGTKKNVPVWYDRTTPPTVEKR